MARFSVVCPPCGARFEAETEDEFVRIVADHAKANHGLAFTREDILERAAEQAKAAAQT